jgi:hypothetical protein
MSEVGCPYLYYTSTCACNVSKQYQSTFSDVTEEKSLLIEISVPFGQSLFNIFSRLGGTI